jgi:hypothetical protein
VKESSIRVGSAFFLVLLRVVNTTGNRRGESDSVGPPVRIERHFM